MLSYSEFKLKEANEPPAAAPPASGGAESKMPDPVSGMPPGSSPGGGLGDIGGVGGLGAMSAGGPGGLGDMSGGMGGGMGAPGDQKPTALSLNASNFWDVLEKMFKQSNEEDKKLD